MIDWDIYKVNHSTYSYTTTPSSFCRCSTTKLRYSLALGVVCSIRGTFAASSQSLNAIISSLNGSFLKHSSSSPLKGPPWNCNDFFDADESVSM